MANKKILLKSTGGDALYPRTSIDNLVDAVGSTNSVTVPVLDQNGKIFRRGLRGKQLEEFIAEQLK